MRRYRESPAYRDGQLGWNSRSVSQDNPRNDAVAIYRPFEERPAIQPYGATSLPSDFYPTTRVIIMTNMGQGTSPRLLRPPTHGLTPRFSGPENMQLPTETRRFNGSEIMQLPPTETRRFNGSANMQLPPTETHRFNGPESRQVPTETRRFDGPESRQVPTENDESKLTKQEQGNALSKMRKEIYNSTPKILERRASLYYRDLNRNPNTKAAEKHKDEDSKSCAVCLEDFQAREEVMVTPCSHMFHEECIVPWVKNHGQCPVCRASFCEKQQNASSFNYNSNVNHNNNTVNNSRRVVAQPIGRRVLLADELLSLIHAVDEAFPWRT